MNRTLLLALIAAIAMTPVNGLAQNGGEPVVTSDLLRIRTVTAIDVARDGTRAVYAVRSIAEKNKPENESRPEFEYRSHLYLVDLSRQNSAPMQLTFGKRNDSSPMFAPDGRSIVFVRSGTADVIRERDQETRGQVWLLPLTGGEARQLTNFEHGATAPRLSPDGSRLLVSSAIPMDELEGVPAWPHERPGRAWGDTPKLDDTDDGEDADTDESPKVEPRPDGSLQEIRAWLERNASDEDPAVFSRIEFQDERALAEPYTFRHLFLVDLASVGDEPIEADEATQITTGFFDHRSAAFMPDGSRIVYVAKKSADQHPDRVRRTDLWIINVDGSDDRVLRSDPEWTFDSPRPNIDGSLIAFSARRTDEPTYRQRHIGLIPGRGGRDAEIVWLTDQFDASVRGLEWMSARGSIVFSAGVQGSVPLFTIGLGVIEPTPVVEGAVGVTTFDAGGGSIVYAQTSPANPCVLKAITARGEVLVHDLNPWVASKTLSLPAEGWIDRPDGARVQYWVMEPTNLLGNRTYPLVLAIHGGPSAMWGPGEASMWHEFQLLCSWGYGVVYSNPRGSGGYGYEFQKANFQDWGEGPGGDVLAAVDRALRLPWVDSDRLVVTGGSYAGYLTTWIVANDHRFKAAVAQRGVYDLVTFFGEGNAWRLVEYAFGGFPWQSNIRAILQRESPFTHVARIRTPLLILHASNDLRTGVSQSEMLYRALKVLNKPVEYVRYPKAGHDLSRSGDPYQRMDRLNRIVEFFERFIENDRPAPVIPDSDSETGEDEGGRL